MQFNQITTELIKLIVIVSMIVLTNYIIPILKQFIEDGDLDYTYDLVETLVRAAEQTITESGKGKTKKALVTAKLSALLKKQDIDISEDEMDNIIEAAVYDMKN